MLLSPPAPSPTLYSSFTTAFTYILIIIITLYWYIYTAAVFLPLCIIKKFFSRLYYCTKLRLILYISLHIFLE